MQKKIGGTLRRSAEMEKMASIDEVNNEEGVTLVLNNRIG